MVIDPFGGQLLSGGNRISLRVSTGFLIEIITGLFYSVKLPNQAPYQLGHTRICAFLHGMHYTLSRCKKQRKIEKRLKNVKESLQGSGKAEINIDILGINIDKILC